MAELNFISILLGALASMVVGMLWYGPLFGKSWMKLMGFSGESMKNMKMTPAKAMSLGYLSNVLMGFVVAYFAAVLGVVDANGALSLTIWFWLGFIATVMLGMVLWEGRSWKLYFLNIGYQFVGLLAMTLVIVLWG